ncbi:hypothetical protein LIER_31519 [Lithospermum erythrorhizon]|uniref:RRM domain-containing protein n=1 Tax=Lithospermum erythrorhizon TaxID=34254 RepID=A0AAV3RWJ2_LITER
MGLRVAARAAVGRRGGVGALFSSVSSSFPFNLPQSQTPPPPKADPSDNLFVSGLSKRTTSEGLHEAFAKFGEIVHARVVTDRVSGYSKGFGLVKYKTIEEAEAGIKGMDGQFLDGWVIFAESARPRQFPPPLENNRNTPYGRQ